MKHKNKLRLASMARANVINGGASALVLANKMLSIMKSSEGLEIVSRVYSHPLGEAVFECKECGSEHLTQSEAIQCCQYIPFDSDFEKPDDEEWVDTAED